MTSRFETRIREETLPPVVKKYFSQSVYVDEMPKDKLAEFQKEALQEVINRAYQDSPFYRQKMTQVGFNPQDFKSLEDLAKLPFTTKDELRQNPWALLACDKKDISMIQVSTGTTGGQQIYSMYTWKEYYLNQSIIYPKVQPVTQDDLCFVALPYEMSSAGLGFHNRFMVGHQAAVVPVGKGGAYSTAEKTVKMMRALKPTIVATSPSHAITIAEAAEEISFDLTSLGLKQIWLGGEGCSPAFRKRVEKIWGTTANFSYGSMEIGTIGNECNIHNGYHIAQGHILIEIIDPQTNKVAKPGEIGEVVITCLLRFDTPMIRYRTQDLGYIDTKPCDCGVSLDKLYLRGRRGDQILLREKAYSPFFLENFLMEMPEVGNWYEFVIKPGNNDQLKVRTEPAAGLEPTAELAEKLSKKMGAAVGSPCEFELAAKMPRPTKKATRVVIDGK